MRWLPSPSACTVVSVSAFEVVTLRARSLTRDVEEEMKSCPLGRRTWASNDVFSPRSGPASRSRHERIVPTNIRQGDRFGLRHKTSFIADAAPLARKRKATDQPEIGVLSYVEQRPAEEL
jgi:hypothetical protein